MRFNFLDCLLINGIADFWDILASFVSSEYQFGVTCYSVDVDVESRPSSIIAPSDTMVHDGRAVPASLQFILKMGTKLRRFQQWLFFKQVSKVACTIKNCQVNPPLAGGEKNALILIVVHHVVVRNGNYFKSPSLRTMGVLL